MAVEFSIMQALSKGESLTESQANSVATDIVQGRLSDQDIHSVLLALAQKGESVDEIVGFAQAMRAAMVRIPIESPCMDVCGTGGSGHVRFNVSTAVAFVLSALGVPVAKHGNRGSAQPNGSFDFLDALGVCYNLTPEQSHSLFLEYQLCFLFARQYHLGVKHAAYARQLLNRRSIFNWVGPLCSPALVTHQIVGTPSIKIAEKLATAVQRLGITRAFVLSGADGSDELTVHDPTILLDVTPTRIILTEVDPQSVGITLKESPKIGGTSTENAKRFQLFLEAPVQDDPLFALLALNSAVALHCFGIDSTIEAAYERVTAAILSGKVKTHLDQYREASLRLGHSTV